MPAEAWLIKLMGHAWKLLIVVAVWVTSDSWFGIHTGVIHHRASLEKILMLHFEIASVHRQHLHWDVPIIDGFCGIIQDSKSHITITLKHWASGGGGTQPAVYFEGVFLFPPPESHIWLKARQPLLIRRTHNSVALRLKWGGKSPVQFKSPRLVWKKKQPFFVF